MPASIVGCTDAKGQAFGNGAIPLHSRPLHPHLSSQGLSFSPTGHPGIRIPVNTPSPGNHESLKVKALWLPALLGSLPSVCRSLHGRCLMDNHSAHTGTSLLKVSCLKVSTVLEIPRRHETRLLTASAGTEKDPGERQPWVMGRFILGLLSKASHWNRLKRTKHKPYRKCAHTAKTSWHDCC